MASLTLDLEPLRNLVRDITRAASPAVTRLTHDVPAATRELQQSVVLPTINAATRIARRTGRRARQSAHAIAADPMPLIVGIAPVALTARLLSRRKMRG